MNIPNTESYSDSSTSTHVSLRTDGIVEVSIQASEIFGPESVQVLEKEAQQFCSESPMPILVIMDEAALVDYEALRYSATLSTEDRRLGEAYVLSNLAQRIVLNFYLKQLKPTVPTRTFSSEEMAVEWLHSLVA